MRRVMRSDSARPLWSAFETFNLATLILLLTGKFGQVRSFKTTD
jgi:hypothetical protein